MAYENFTRPEGMSILDYINKFDPLNEVTRKYKMELPDGVLAYWLLKSANISKEKQQLARATLTELTFANMRKQLKAIHDSASDHYGIQAELPIKVEPVYEVTDFKHESEVLFNRSGGQQRGNYRGRARSYGNNRNNQSRNQSYGNTRGARNWSGNNSRQINRKTPVDSSGNPSRCAICESVYHWVRDCPDKGKDPGNVEITLFCKEIEECYLESFLGESFNSAILDSGCSRTVCGKTWFKCYKDSLSNDYQNKIQEFESNVDFKFGDGKVYRSMEKAIIPASIGNLDVKIETNVITCDIPLLLSRESMKATHTQINFAEDKVTMLGKTLNLQFTSSGHYSVLFVSQSRSSFRIRISKKLV